VKPIFLANFLIKRLITILLALTLLTFSSITLAFTDTDGKTASIEDYLGKGKFTVVEVWATDCHACREHMPSMVKFDGKLKNTQVIGVSIDGQAGADKVDDFIMEYGMKFPNLISNAIEMNIWMQQNTPEGLIGTPAFMIFNPKGQLFAMQAGMIRVDQIERLIKEKSQESVETEKKG